MVESLGLKTSSNQTAFYQVRVKGHLGCKWDNWFEGLTLTQEDNGDTLLSGVVDQAALYGLLRKVRDLGLPLMSVTRLEPTQEKTRGKAKGKYETSSRESS